MRPVRGRAKKLILAFHFQFSDQARWRCETCRQAGLEKQRRCEYLTESERGPDRAVWSRKRVVATACPKSLISAESLAWIEEFQVWRLVGGADYRTLTARQVDAISALEQLLRAERMSSDD
jgi:hypothetical protein